MSAGASLARSCQRSCLSVLCQWIAAVAFIAVCIYAAAFVLRPLQLLGVSSIPPGLLHHERRH